MLSVLSREVDKLHHHTEMDSTFCYLSILDLTSTHYPRQKDTQHYILLPWGKRFFLCYRITAFWAKQSCKSCHITVCVKIKYCNTNNMFGEQKRGLWKHWWNYRTTLGVNPTMMIWCEMTVPFKHRYSCMTNICHATQHLWIFSPGTLYQI